jgi:hypothetical protein
VDQVVVDTVNSVNQALAYSPIMPQFDYCV